MPTQPPGCRTIDEYVDQVCEFIQRPFFRRITGGIHVNDALIYDAWGALPHEWTQWWSTFADHRLAQRDLIRGVSVLSDDIETSASGPAPHRPTRPESLTEWLSTVRALSLPRVPAGDIDPVAIPEILATALETKKRAEVAVAAAYIAQTCRDNAITRIVDVGSGQGYLPITLAYLHPELRILAVDGSEAQVTGSRALASSLGLSDDRLSHLVLRVDGGPELGDCAQDWAEGERCMLVGLHACGSLSEHMVRCFVQRPCFSALAVIGCCYNHISRRATGDPDGFPISTALYARGADLSPTALMTGCQAPENWLDQSCAQGTAVGDASKRRFYRALLEKVFHDLQVPRHNTSGASGPSWGIRKRDLASFDAFARRAMDSLNIDHETISSEILHTYEKRYHGHESRIAILWTLGAVCSNLVESAVALDRVCYLREHYAGDVDILPVFHYAISPRNMMLVARKTPG